MNPSKQEKNLHTKASERTGATNDNGILLSDPMWRRLRRWKKRIFRRRHEAREPLFLTLWLIWLLVGSLFYAYAPKNSLGFAKGFYMAVNIGYSIGFGYPVEDYNIVGDYIYFSSIYVLLGASFVSVSLGFFAEKVTRDKQSWFTKMQKDEEIADSIRKRHCTYLQGNVQAWVFRNSKALKAVSLWLGFIISMITYSMLAVKWTFAEAQYFAVSTLSTGGHMPIPSDSENWLFGLTAMMAMLGVPVMAVAMAEIAQVLISHGKLDEAKTAIDAIVTKEELEFLQHIGLEDFNGEVDKAGFIILCMIRLGTDPGLITYVTQRFAELNFYNGAPLTVAEITQGECRYVDGRIRRKVSIATEVLTVVSEDENIVPDASTSYLHYSHIKPARKDVCLEVDPFAAQQRLKSIPEESISSAHSGEGLKSIPDEVVKSSQRGEGTEYSNGIKISSGSPFVQNGDHEVEETSQKCIAFDRKRRAAVRVVRASTRDDSDEVSEEARQESFIDNQEIQSVSPDDMIRNPIDENTTGNADNPITTSSIAQRPIYHSNNATSSSRNEGPGIVGDTFLSEMEEGRLSLWNSSPASFDSLKHESN